MPKTCRGSCHCGAVRLLGGEAASTPCLFNSRKSPHGGCRHCGVRRFGPGTDTPIGRMYGVKLGCLEGKWVDGCRVRNCGFFVREVVAAWVDAKVKNARTLHHRGYGSFVVAGRTIRLPSTMR